MNFETTDFTTSRRLGGLAIEFEVERLHRARAVQGEDHVHAAGFDRRGAAAELRPGQPDDEQREREEAERPIQRPARLRVSRATWRAMSALEYFTAATGPRRAAQEREQAAAGRAARGS